MIDLVVTGDRVVTPHDVGPADVAIGGGKVVAVAAKGAFPVPEGARVVDAVGKIVMDDMAEDVVPRALFFHARHVSPRWKLKRISSVGNHVFYR